MNSQILPFLILRKPRRPSENPQQTVDYQVLVRCSRRAACLDVEALLHEAHLRRELLVHGRREAPERRVERVRRGPAREAQSLHRHRERQRRPRLRRLDLSYRPDLFKVQETSSPS